MLNILFLLIVGAVLLSALTYKILGAVLLLFLVLYSPAIRVYSLLLMFIGVMSVFYNKF